MHYVTYDDSLTYWLCRPAYIIAKNILRWSLTFPYSYSSQNHKSLEIVGGLIGFYVWNFSQRIGQFLQPEPNKLIRIWDTILSSIAQFDIN